MEHFFLTRVDMHFCLFGGECSGFIAVPEKVLQAPLTGGKRGCPYLVQWPPEGPVKATMWEPGALKKQRHFSEREHFMSLIFLLAVSQTGEVLEWVAVYHCPG